MDVYDKNYNKRFNVFNTYMKLFGLDDYSIIIKDFDTNNILTYHYEDDPTTDYDEMRVTAIQIDTKNKTITIEARKENWNNGEN